jgi:hypothetical protein
MERFSVGINELIATAEKLPLEQQLQLITHLLNKLRQVHSTAAPRPRWRQLCGVAPYPLTGTDAQTWVSSTRAEADVHRSQALG